MIYTTRSVSIYKLLYYCEKLNVSKSVLDCGAGRGNPPLYIFAHEHYKVQGIDLSDKSIGEANGFERTFDTALHIGKGDMRNLKFADNEFGCCYSFNTIFHMTKGEVLDSLSEMIRITEPKGILYFNVLSKKDERYGVGNQLDKDTYYCKEEAEYHSFYDDDEMDNKIKGCRILEKGITHFSVYDKEVNEQYFIEYYVQKN